MAAVTTRYPDFIELGLSLARDNPLVGTQNRLHDKVKAYLRDPDIQNQFFAWGTDFGTNTNSDLLNRMFTFLRCGSEIPKNMLISPENISDQDFFSTLPKEALKIVRIMEDYSPILSIVFFNEGLPEEDYTDTRASVIRDYIQHNQLLASQQLTNYFDECFGWASKSELKNWDFEFTPLFKAAFNAGLPITKGMCHLFAAGYASRSLDIDASFAEQIVTRVINSSIPVHPSLLPRLLTLPLSLDSAKRLAVKFLTILMQDPLLIHTSIDYYSRVIFRKNLLNLALTRPEFRSLLEKYKEIFYPQGLEFERYVQEKIETSLNVNLGKNSNWESLIKAIESCGSLNKESFLVVLKSWLTLGVLKNSERA